MTHNQQLLIKQFEIIAEQQGGAFLYTPEVTAHLTNKKLISLLQTLKAHSLQKIDLKQLNELIDQYDLTETSVKQYLQRDLKILSLLSKDRFEKIFIISDSKEIQNHLSAYLTETHGIKTYINSLAMIDEKSLVLIFNQIYDPQTINDVYAIAAHTNAWVLSSYLIHHYLMIDNIFNSEKGAPCHFCNLQRFNNIVISKNNIKQTSWINYCRRLLENDIESLPAITVGKIEIGLILFWLARTIRNFIDVQGCTLFVNDIYRYSAINLHNAEAHHEHATHWSFCKCLN